MNLHGHTGVFHVGVAITELKRLALDRRRCVFGLRGLVGVWQREHDQHSGNELHSQQGIEDGMHCFGCYFGSPSSFTDLPFGSSPKRGRNG